MALQLDGKVLVGGEFTQLGGQPRNHLARLNPDGSLDAGFNPDANGLVYGLAVQPDGKVLVGGRFTELGGQPCNHLARLNPDGSLDAGFNPGTSNTSFVYGLALQPDGKVLVGGIFTELGGEPRSHIGRLSLPEAALQELTVSADRSTLSWQRSGAGPELERVWFEQSADAVDYVALGEAVRVPGGWSLILAEPLPQNQDIWLRARGSSRDGVFNASGSLHESVLWFHDRSVHEVTVNATGNGTATPPSQSISYGEDATLTLAPDAGHHVTSVTGDTCTPLDNGDGTWTAAHITADCAIDVVFAINQYTVTFVDWDASVLSMQTVDHGDAAVAPADPTRPGYTFTGWDVPFGNVTSDLTVTAQYAINQYTVTAPVAGSHGTIAPATQQVDHGDDAQFTVTPEAGYHGLLNGDSCNPADNGDGTWSAHTITADCQVTASFAQNLAEAVQVHAGDGQATPVLDDFAQALTVRVADAADAPLAGITVSFSTPGSGASAMLSATSVLTDTDGLARITATANGIAGSYLVQARVGGVATAASFALENAPLTATVSLSMSPASPAPGSTVDFTVTVSGGGALQPGGTVDVLVDGVVVCAAIALVNGSATCQAGPFANAPHQAWARYPGDAAHAPADSSAIAFEVHAPMPVPVNNPWALAGLVALFGLVGVSQVRRRKRGLPW